MEVTHTSALHARAELVAKLFGTEVDLFDPDEIDGDPKNHRSMDEPLTVGRMAEAVLNRNRRHAPPTADMVAAQQRGISVVAEELRLAYGRVTVRDGELSAEFVELEYSRISVATEPPKEKDPLIVDLDGDGFETTGVEGGGRFDVDADGVDDQVSTATGGDALLVMDRDGNGRIDDGRELFGDHHGAADGIAELGRLDVNGDGRIDASDPAWGDLGLWADHDRNGVSDVGEVRTLEDAGFTAIDLTRQAYRGTASGGDRLVDAVTFVRSDGSTSQAADAYLRYS